MVFPHTTRASIRSHEKDGLNIQIRNRTVTAYSTKQACLGSPACFIQRLQSILVMIVIAVAVSPGPVFLLFFGAQFPEVSVFVSMVFPRPRVVVRNLIIVPDVVIAVVGVIDSVVMMMGAGHACH
jgi:hypothetical protein